MIARDSKSTSKKLSKSGIDNIRKTISTFEKDIVTELKYENAKIKNFIEKIGDTIKSDLTSIPASIDEINIYFTKLNEKLYEENVQGYYTVGDSTFQRLSLIVNWYHFVLFESYISNELMMIHDNLEEKDVDVIELIQQSQLIERRVKEFNSKLREIEIQEYSTSKLSIIDYSINDLNSFFSTVVNEELKLEDKENKENLAFQLSCESESLKRKILDYKLSSAIFIDKFIKNETQKSKERLELYDGSLEIDFYYLEEFQKNPILKEYDNITNNIQYNNINRMNYLIHQYNNRKQNFEVSLQSYFSLTSSKPALLYSKNIIDIIFNLIHSAHHKSLEMKTIHSMEEKYRSKFEFIKKELPLKKDEIIDKFKSEANLYLMKAFDDSNIAEKYRHEAKMNFDKRINEFAQPLMPLTTVDDIMKICVDQIQKEKLNEVWDVMIAHVMNKELLFLKKTFLPIEIERSEKNIKLVKSIRHHMWKTVKSILDNQIKRQGISSERSTELEKILFKNCDKIAKDDIFERMDQYLGVSRKRKPVVYLQEIIPKVKPWYQYFYDKPWKKAIGYSILVCGLLALSFTIYGLIVSLPVVLSAVSGWAGIVGIGISGCSLPFITIYGKKFFRQSENAYQEKSDVEKSIRHSNNIISGSLPVDFSVNNHSVDSVVFSKPIFRNPHEKSEHKIEEKISKNSVIAQPHH